MLGHLPTPEKLFFGLPNGQKNDESLVFGYPESAFPGILGDVQKKSRAIITHTLDAINTNLTSGMGYFSFCNPKINYKSNATHPASQI